MKKLLFPMLFAATFCVGFFSVACQKENAKPQSVATADEQVSDRLQEAACFCHLRVQTGPKGADGSAPDNILTFNYVQPSSPFGAPGVPGTISVNMNVAVNQVHPIEVLKGTNQSWSISGTPNNDYQAAIRLTCDATNTTRLWKFDAYKDIFYSKTGTSLVDKSCIVF